MQTLIKIFFLDKKPWKIQKISYNDYFKVKKKYLDQSKHPIIESKDPKKENNSREKKLKTSNQKLYRYAQQNPYVLGHVKLIFCLA